MTTVTNTYTEGGGKYQDDYNRLMNLVPSCKGKGKGRTTRSQVTVEDNDKVESVAAEVMRTVNKLNDAFYTNGTLTDLLGAFNFLALSGMFDEDQHNTLSTLSPYVKGEKDYDGTKEEGDDVIQPAVGRVNDLAIEFLLKYPDMEWWIDRSFNMAALQKKGDFISLAIAKQTTMKSSPPTNKEAQVPIQEIQTPRMANVEYVI